MSLFCSLNYLIKKILIVFKQQQSLNIIRVAGFEPATFCWDRLDLSVFPPLRTVRAIFIAYGSSSLFLQTKKIFFMCTFFFDLHTNHPYSSGPLLTKQKKKERKSQSKKSFCFFCCCDFLSFFFCFLPKKNISLITREHLLFELSCTLTLLHTIVETGW